jgi:hypothetical protein
MIRVIHACTGPAPGTTNTTRTTRIARIGVRPVWASRNLAEDGPTLRETFDQSLRRDGPVSGKTLPGPNTENRQNRDSCPVGGVHLTPEQARLHENNRP